MSRDASLAVTMPYREEMCRNITMLRGLEPPATHDEVRDAARQYVRKVGALSSGPMLESEAVLDAVEQITLITEQLLLSLPPRRQPPRTVPPGRRRPLS